ncbi:Stp1/IreP family PP2C-type Ser/Thr phosphatase [Humidisolicoccus flavus]|uniref:Stp1/IreP family PP2C-type Ser/Thr phosphatase n=1 Tax=Humidisolicoccus flavus TaxID=3111414 RepID=UPI003243641F
MQTPLQAAVSHVGRVRSDNQDSGYAGTQFYAVADGMGGHAGGDVASAITIRRLRDSDREYDGIEDARSSLVRAVKAANTALQDAMREHPELQGMGTTFSGLVRVGDQAVIAHVGDSRIYRFRGGRISQVTTDHTFVQKLVEAGRITREEAEHHPRRNVVMRILGNVETNPEIDSMVEPIREGDRWILCSDGLSSYVPEERIESILAAGRDARATTQRLLQEALSAGAPDNVTIVMMDVDDENREDVEPVVVGSATKPVKYEAVEQERAPIRLTSILFHPIQTLSHVAPEHYEPESEEYLEDLIREQRKRNIRRRLIWSFAGLLAVIGVIVAGFFFYEWTQTHYFVGISDGHVAIFQGIQQGIGPFTLSSVVETTDIDIDTLDAFTSNAVEGTISADSLTEAREIVERLEAAP